jgi:hypothetical protein
VTDRCALCFRVLEPSPNGGRYACTNKAHRGARRRPYWSEVVPEYGETEGTTLVSKHGRPTLHVYGS